MDIAIARHQLSGYFRRGRAERKAIRRVGIEVPPVEPDDLDRIEELAGLGALRFAVNEGRGSAQTSAMLARPPSR